MGPKWPDISAASLGTNVNSQLATSYRPYARDVSDETAYYEDAVCVVYKNLHAVQNLQLAAIMNRECVNNSLAYPGVITA